MHNEQANMKLVDCIIFMQLRSSHNLVAHPVPARVFLQQRVVGLLYKPCALSSHDQEQEEHKPSSCMQSA